MKRKLLLFSVICLFFAQAAIAQNLIKGVVKDTKGVGIPGVSVSVANSKKATVTDFEGKYSIPAAADATLTFTYLGYISQNADVAGKTQLDITLQEDSKTLGEVVVTAIGIKQQKKKLVMQRRK
ncbi:carboxypeptidase-like regulatory domain-containing protein [Pedobacter panaciterrae]